jgi:hypothetical protein
LDESVPDIWFDQSGECNYCKTYDLLQADYPNDSSGEKRFAAIVTEAKRKGDGKDYDVVIGVSGGTDSTYLLHLAIEHGLRPLAVHLDNGWNTEVSVVNLKNVLEALDIDLYTHVIQWDEFKDILRSQLMSGLPWADSPTDLAINSIVNMTAVRFGIRTVFIGHDFRTEGRQPTDWTHSDTRQLHHIHRRFGSGIRSTFPGQSPFHLIYNSAIRGIKVYRPFWHLPYSKTVAKGIITDKYGWRDYGGHHHENVFTRYVIGVWMPLKFGIDKRKVSFSAYIRNGEMSRADALAQISQPAYEEGLMMEDHHYVAKKLGFSIKEMDLLWSAPNHSVHDFPSYLPLFNRFKAVATTVLGSVLPFKPMTAYQVKKPV